MPEGTKTNGLGVLQIEKGIMKMFNDASTPEQNLRLHSIRFDHLFYYRPSYNTTDEYGIYNTINALVQFSSIYAVSYYFDLEGMIHDCVNDNDKHEFVKTTLMIETKEQSMKLSWMDHKEFLKYWQETQGSKTYTKNKKIK